jgi:hypothetical protein
MSGGGIDCEVGTTDRQPEALWSVESTQLLVNKTIRALPVNTVNSTHALADVFV